MTEYNKGMNLMIKNGFKVQAMETGYTVLSHDRDNTRTWATINFDGVVRATQLGRFNNADFFLREYFGS